MNAVAESGQTILNYVNGKWEPAVSGQWAERFDPADTHVLVGRAPNSGREDARRAIEAAQRASETWSAWPAPKRGRLLFDWLAWIDARRDKLANLLTREEGKILAESKGEVRRA